MQQIKRRLPSYPLRRLARSGMQIRAMVGAVVTVLLRGAAGPCNRATVYTTKMLTHYSAVTLASLHSLCFRFAFALKLSPPNAPHFYEKPCFFFFFFA